MVIEECSAVGVHMATSYSMIEPPKSASLTLRSFRGTPSVSVVAKTGLGKSLLELSSPDPRRDTSIANVENGDIVGRDSSRQTAGLSDEV